MIYDYIVFLYFENNFIYLKRSNKVFLLNIIIDDFKKLMCWIMYLYKIVFKLKMFVKKIFKEYVIMIIIKMIDLLLLCWNYF